MSRRGRLKLAVLISGRGSNMLALAHACRTGQLNAGIVLVLSDRADAAGIAAAAALDLPASALEARELPSRERIEDALAQAVDGSGAELLLLAGFMRILSSGFVQRYHGRLLNIHPSLLPKYPGLHTHRRALEAGEREHGASVHFVTAELDGGPVICQARVAVRPDDTERTLAARVLEQEHRLYPLAVGLIADGRLELKEAGIVLDGQALPAPLELEPLHVLPIAP
jgi:phosphoribosylglycinamide formyltransferase-1